MRVLPVLGIIFLAFKLPAASVDRIVVFGDSLSDNGNVAIATNNLFPGSNYDGGRFTNGPGTTPASAAPVGLWVEQLAGRLGVAAPQPFLAGGGGTNYAVASATTGSNGLYNISDQVGIYGLTHPGGADANALYTFWGGANDLFNGSGSPTGAAASLAGNIQLLAAAGAKNFLWVNLPPLGSTPRAVAEGSTASLTAAALAFNQTWAKEVLLLRGLGINVTGVDANALFTSIASNPGSFGFTNVATPAQGLAGVDPNSYLFWDIQHPTTAGHAAVANAAYDSLSAPEPETAATILAGLAVLAGLRRVKRFRFFGDLRLRPKQ